MSKLFAGLLSVIVATSLSQAASGADVAKGETLAKRWCATCHVVAADQQIAKMPDLDPAKLALFLLLPHPKMPDMNLSRDEAADLAAYIVSQGKAR
jgi:mono/diheme cytochrome c family protein